jgi:inositol phosphorylceramide mannosyltransferase catalytic subunit
MISKKNITLNKILSSPFFQSQRIASDFHIKIEDLEYWSWIIRQYQNFLKYPGYKQIVPKKIHQIWIGGQAPKKYDLWRNSWKKNHPDYEYFLWDEQKILQLDLINRKQFVETKYPVVKSNLARHEILFKFGGIYVDTDFESLKKIEEKYLTRSFMAGEVCGYSPNINDAIMIASKGSKLLELVINGFKKKKLPSKMNPMEILHYCGVFYLSKIIKKNRKILRDIVITPSQYFYPWPNFMTNNSSNRYSYVSKKSLAIHHWEVSWYTNSIFSKIFKKIKFF